VVDLHAKLGSLLAKMANLAGTQVAKQASQRGTRPRQIDRHRIGKETTMLALNFNTKALDEMFTLTGELADAIAHGNTETGRRPAWTPTVEVRETEDAVQMTVELAGVAPRDVNLVFQNGVLTLSGKKAPVGADKETLQYTERWYGYFERSFSLPAGLQSEKIEAAFHDGVLTIRLLKSEQAKSRRIPITIGPSPVQVGTAQTLKTA
jgi:HSP20 family protein